MRIFTVNISYSVIVDAEDEDDAKRQAVDCYEFGSADYEVTELEIVPCKNGVGDWEISPLHETFDTREEAERRLEELVYG